MAERHLGACEDCERRAREIRAAKEVVRVRVWYADCAVRESLDWQGLPEDGVQMVRVDYADGTGRLIYGADFYFTFQAPLARAYGHCDGQPPDASRYPGAKVLRGAWTDDATFAVVEAWALDGGG